MINLTTHKNKLILLKHRLLFIILFIFLGFATAFSQNKTSILIPEQLRNSTSKKNVIDIQNLLQTELKSIDSVYIYPPSEIDSILRLYKIHNIHHDILFNQALGNIFKADYIIQTKNIIKKNSYDIRLYLFDTNLGKYVQSYFMKLNHLQPEVYSDSITAVVRSFQKHVFKSDSITHINKDSLNNESKFTHLDSLNRRHLYSGYMIIESDYPNAKVVHNGDTVCTTPVLFSGISHGLHVIEVVNSKNKISQTFRSDENKPRMNHYFAKISPAWLTVTGSPDHAEVDIKDTKEEFVPWEKILVTTKPFEISIRKNGYYQLTETLSLSPFEHRAAHYTLKPKNKIKATLLSALFPGLGQFYRGSQIHGYVYTGLEVLSILTFAGYELKFRNEIDKYNSLKKKNPQTGSSSVNIKREKILNDAYDSLKKYKQKRDITILITAAVWAINMLDVYLWQPKPGFSGKIGITYIESSHFNASPTLGIKYMFD